MILTKWKKTNNMLQNHEELKEDFDEVPVNENQNCYPDEDCLEILKKYEGWMSCKYNFLI